MNSAGSFDVIVVGAGHAGCEAALAASRMGCSVLFITLNSDKVAAMSCNPAIGGIGKGHIVREIDALGGEMARTIDRTGIQFRLLNRRKGPAVRGPRAQADKSRYSEALKQVVEAQERLDLVQDEVVDLLVDSDGVSGVRCLFRGEIEAKTVVICAGTFLSGMMHIGTESFAGGRLGDPPSRGLASSLELNGFDLRRLKTGTPPRLDGETIDFSKLTPQPGDEPPPKFSFRSSEVNGNKIRCYLARTTPNCHRIIRDNLKRSALFSGKITGVGIRYCPSIEDKIKRFPQRETHHIFIEPEGLSTSEYYANGFATSLPFDVQIAMLRSVDGLQDVRITRPGYAIEYAFIQPTELHPWLETKRVKRLFLAGQINGTSGYEEAAGQGLLAGINAALQARGEPPFVMTRREGYIGVMIDDLVSLGCREPYRMFTARSEHRLLLSADTADVRLMGHGHRFGLIDDDTFSDMKRRQNEREAELFALSHKVCRDECQDEFGNKSLLEIIRRPDVSYADLTGRLGFESRLGPPDQDIVEMQVKYEGYIRREEAKIERWERLDGVRIPQQIDFDAVPGLRAEIRQRLAESRPATLGAARRLPGITPAAISVLSIYIASLQRSERNPKPSEAEGSRRI
ncbi:tRNA uridine-5-carboxymethylaminomethyl(34) synthesis enzyme MnmG [bacterium]|nr:tRNA uridine-5-carboxymethylaminomethyl(34) synthesis enzyme MnmG [bacterium]